MSVRLYIGNLPKELERKELQDVFAEEGDTVSAKVITDRKTGKCRGFGFVTVQTDEVADQIVEKYNGVMFRENALKMKKHYLGKKEKVTVLVMVKTVGKMINPNNSNSQFNNRLNHRVICLKVAVVVKAGIKNLSILPGVKLLHRELAVMIPSNPILVGLMN